MGLGDASSSPAPASSGNNQGGGLFGGFKGGAMSSMGPSDTSDPETMLRLQQTMEQRQQMFQMMSSVGAQRDDVARGFARNLH